MGRRHPPLAHGMSSIGTSACEHDTGGLEQDVEVERQGPVLDVEEIHPQGFLILDLAAAVDLPPASDARLDFMSRREEQGIGIDLLGSKSPRADQTHVSPNDVPELG